MNKSYHWCMKSVVFIFLFTLSARQACGQVLDSTIISRRLSIAIERVETTFPDWQMTIMGDKIHFRKDSVFFHCAGCVRRNYAPSEVGFSVYFVSQDYVSRYSTISNRNNFIWEKVAEIKDTCDFQSSTKQHYTDCVDMKSAYLDSLMAEPFICENKTTIAVEFIRKGSMLTFDLSSFPLLPNDANASLLMLERKNIISILRETL